MVCRDTRSVGMVSRYEMAVPLGILKFQETANARTVLLRLGHGAALSTGSRPIFQGVERCHEHGLLLV